MHLATARSGGPSSLPARTKKENPAEAGFPKPARGEPSRGLVELLRLDGVGLQTLLTLYDGERHLLAFLQALEALGLDGAEVDEHVFAILTADEAEALGVVEPLDGTGFTGRHFYFLLGTLVENATCDACWLQGGSEVQRCSGSTDQPHRATIHGDPGKHSDRKVPRTA